MINCLAVGIGGFIGTVLRYLIGLIPLENGYTFPIKTLIINIIGSFIISAVSVLALKNRSIDPRMILLLKTGLCGGFTTFSTFAYETASLMESHSYSCAFLYIILSVTLGIAAIFAAEFLLSN